MLPPSWKTEVQKTIEESASAERDQRKAEQNEASANIAAAINALRDAQAAQTNSEDANEKKNQAINKATLALVAFTVLFTGLSWLAFREQLKEMRKVYDPIKQSADAAKAAAEAANKQATAADKQVTAMQGQLDEMRAQRLINIAQTRANLVRDAVAHAHTNERKLTALSEKIIEYSFSPFWKNTGSTEARAWRAWFDIKVFDIGPIRPRHLGSKDCPELVAPDPLPDEQIIARDGIVIQLAK